jgi:hypothetical protein
VELYLHSPNTPSWRGAQGELRDNFYIIYKVRNQYKILVGKSQWKRPFGKPGDNIKMDIQEIGFGGVDWIHRIQVMSSSTVL